LDTVYPQYPLKKSSNDSVLLSFDVKSKTTFKIECKLYSSDGKDYKEISLLIDTGASQTAIVRNVLTEFGYIKFTKSKYEKQTATGRKTFDITKISQLHMIGIYKRKNFEVEVLDWKKYSYHGIIGMDILSRLHFRSDTKLFELQNKPFDFQPIQLAQTSPLMKRGVKGVALEFPTQYSIVTETEWVDNMLIGSLHSIHDSLEQAEDVITELKDKAENVVVTNLDRATKNTVLWLLELNQLKEKDNKEQPQPEENEKLPKTNFVTQKEP